MGDWLTKKMTLIKQETKEAIKKTFKTVALVILGVVIATSFILAYQTYFEILGK